MKLRFFVKEEAEATYDGRRMNAGGFTVLHVDAVALRHVTSSGKTKRDVKPPSRNSLADGVVLLPFRLLPPTPLQRSLQAGGLCRRKSPRNKFDFRHP